MFLPYVLLIMRGRIVGLLIGLQTIRVFCPSLDKQSEKWTRFEWSEHYRMTSARFTAIGGCIGTPTANSARRCGVALRVHVFLLIRRISAVNLSNSAAALQGFLQVDAGY
jgi:hypothetical protein